MSVIALRPMRCLVFCMALLGTSQAAVTANVKVPVDIPVFIPCAANGAGELVELQGNLHMLVRVTIDGKGGVHAATHAQPQGISGTGRTTGDKYHGTGVTQDQFNAKLGVEETFVNNFRIIGQGSGNNFLIHENFHVTINPNGTVTAFVDNFSVDCR